MHCPPLPTDEAPLLVLDTNVVLDWLVFQDPGCAALGQALTAGRVRWVATGAMRDELGDVLVRGSLDAWVRRAAVRVPSARDDAQVAPWDAKWSGIWAAWDRWATLAPAPSVAHGVPHCTDPDDQKFIDLALHIGASALLSRDRAVLRCARGALALGLVIQTPTEWGKAADR